MFTICAEATVTPPSFYSITGIRRDIRIGYSGKLDLRRVTAELKDVTAWFDLGLKLGIEHSVLKRIRSDYCHEGAERCKTEVLAFWIDNGTDVSLKKLTEALEEINHRNLARHLQEKYNVPQTGTMN